MGKRLLSIILAVILLFSCVPCAAFAASTTVTSGTYDNVLIYEIRDGCVWITGCKSTAIEVDIPEEIEGYPVTAIGNEAFYYCNKLTKITIPKTIATIEGSVFFGCEKLLTAGSIGSGNNIEFGWDTAIPNNAFSECDSLCSISIPDSITSIGSNAFYGCDALANIELPSEITSIGSYTFYGTSYFNNTGNWSNDALYINDYLITVKDSATGTYVVQNTTTCIADGAFRGCSDLSKVEIPFGISALGDMTFYGCEGLTSIEIPNSVQTIGSSTFFNCSKLSTITIPDSVKSIEQTSFDGCTGLTSLIIGGGLDTVPRLAFSQCSALTSVKINEGVKTLEMHAFSGCANLTNIEIPDSVTNISRYVFSGTAYYGNPSNWEDGVLYIDHHLVATKDTLENVYAIKDGTICIAGGSFWGCKQLNTVIIPNTVKAIGAETFYYSFSYEFITNIHYLGTPAEWNAVYLCDEALRDYVTKNWFTYVIANGEVEITGINYNFGDVTIPKTIAGYPVTSIAQSAFGGNKEITSVIVPEGVQKIGIGAFASCENLKSISIPGSVTSIGQNAFNNTAFYNNTDNWENGLLYIGNHLVDVKKDGSIGADVVIKDGTITLADYLFCLESIATATIPTSVKYIGNSAFYGFSGIVHYNGYYDEWLEINIGEGNQGLLDAPIYHKNKGSYAEYLTYEIVSGTINITGFSNSTQGIDVEIPSIIQGRVVTSIGDGAFYESGIKTLVIPNSVTRIGKNAFASCAHLTSIVIPDSVISLGDGAFSNCTSLKYVTLSNQIPSIGDYTFLNCPHLIGIEMPASVTSIGMQAFWGCSQMNYLLLSDNITSIGDYAFVGAPLAELRLPSKLATMGICVFEGCEKLAEVIVPWGVTSIGVGAFANCLELETVTIPDSIKTVNNNAFNGCAALTDIWYMGSENRKGQIAIGSYNNEFRNATWHYNSCETHTYAADCDADCDVCEYFRRNTVGHAYGNWEIDEFTHSRKCEDCSWLELSPHNWDSGVITTQPSHIAFGERTYTCQDCSAIKTEEIAKTTDHTYSSWTKLEDDNHQGTCACGDTVVQPHNWDDGVITIAPTHLAVGVKTYTCEKCGATRTEDVPQGEHTYVAWSKIDDEIHQGTCECGDVKTENHTMQFVETIVAPSLGTKGENKYQCTKCSHTIIEMIDIISSGYCGAGGNGGYFTDITWELHTDGTLVFTGNGLMANYGYNISQPWHSVKESVLNVIIGDGITSVGAFAFVDCINLANIQFSTTVSTIGSNAFVRCTELESIAIPQNVCQIDYNTFTGCTSLKNIVLPDTLTEIRAYALNGCTALETIVLPSSIKTVGRGVFDGNTATISVYYDGSKMDWDEVALGENNDVLTKNLIFMHVLPSDPTCSEPGSLEYWMGYDGTGYYTDKTRSTAMESSPIIPALGHIEVIDCEVAPTCTESGLTEGSHCSVCNKVLVAQETIAATGHTETDISAIDATCTAPGLTAGKKCSVCGEIVLQQATVYPVGHIDYDGNGICDLCSVVENVSNGIYCSGTFGNTVNWTLTAWGVLTISGNGSIESWDDVVALPWGNYRMMIREVIIEDGVTTIGSNAFSDCLNLRFITLPISCVSINSYAFSGVDSLDAVFYKGNSSDWDNVSVASEGNAALTNALVKHNIKVTGIIGGTSGLAYYVDISNIFALIGDPPVDTSVYVATYLSNGKMTGIHIITVGNNPITIDEDADIGRIYLLDTGVSPVCVNEVLAY